MTAEFSKELAGQNLEQLAQIVEESKKNAELWKSVLETAADPIIAINQVGTIIEANPATSNLFGYTNEELVGQNVSKLMPEKYRLEHDGYLQRYLETGEAHIMGSVRELEACKADGSLFPMALSVSEVATSGEKMFTGIIHDLTERYKSETELRRLNEHLEELVADRTAELETSMERLEQSNRDLEQFAYIASHDLQAPLRNVGQGLQLLDEHLVETLGDGLDIEANELRNLVMGSVDRMKELISGLLTYSSVQQQSDSDDVIVDLKMLVDDIVVEFANDLIAVGASVEVGELPQVRGNRTLLRQLLQNLISNAYKYRSTERKLQVQITGKANDDMWLLCVSDNGIGVDSAQHKRIFELFRRGHLDRSGIGIGLAICKRVVEHHNGAIWLESEVAEGTKLFFTLPKIK